MPFVIKFVTAWKIFVENLKCSSKVFNLVIFILQVLWKAYIDFEINLEEYDRTRDLYERLLTRTQHVKVNISKTLVLSNEVIKVKLPP